MKNGIELDGSREGPEVSDSERLSVKEPLAVEHCLPWLRALDRTPNAKL